MSPTVERGMREQQMHGERVRDTLALSGESGVGQLIGRRRVQREGEHDRGLLAEPEPAGGFRGGRAAVEHAAQLIGPQTPLHVGIRALPDHVHRDELRRVAEHAHMLLAERRGRGDPDRPEHLVAGAHGHDGAAAVCGLARRRHLHGVVAAADLLEDAGLLQQAGVVRGELPAPGRRALLRVRERQQLGVAVLDRHGRLEQRCDRVGHREEVAREDAAERHGARVVGPPGGHQGAEQTGQVSPGGAGGEREEHDTRAVRRGTELVVGGEGRAHDEAGRPAEPEPREHLHDVVALLEADAEHDRVARGLRLVSGVVDRHRLDRAVGADLSGDHLEQGAAELLHDVQEARLGPVVHRGSHSCEASTAHRAFIGPGPTAATP